MLSAAASAPDEETYKHYSTTASELLSLINLRAANEAWEKAVFDSRALTILLQDIAADFLWLAITARSWEASVDRELVRLLELLEQEQEP